MNHENLNMLALGLAIALALSALADLGGANKIVIPERVLQERIIGKACYDTKGRKVSDKSKAVSYCLNTWGK